MKEKALTGVAFAVGNVCATYPAVGSRPKASSRDDPEVELNTTSSVTSALSEPCGLTQVTWETTLYQPVFRKLVNESSRTFLALQKSMSDEENERKKFFIMVIEEMVDIRSLIVRTFYSIILCKSRLMISNPSSTSVVLVIEGGFNLQKFS